MGVKKRKCADCYRQAGFSALANCTKLGCLQITSGKAPAIELRGLGKRRKACLQIADKIQIKNKFWYILICIQKY